MYLMDPLHTRVKKNMVFFYQDHYYNYLNIINPLKYRPFEAAFTINPLTRGSAPNVRPATAFDLVSFKSKNKSLIKCRPSLSNDTGLQFK